jgi:undecaprenyl-diphosphatase
MRAGGYLLSGIFFAFMVALGFAANAGVMDSVDQPVLRLLVLREGISPAWQIMLARWVTWIGDGDRRTLITVAFAAWFIWERRFKAALIMAVLPALGGVASSLLKVAFGRPRPTIAPHIVQAGGLAYPSGHAVTGVVFLFAAMLLPGASPRLRVALALVATVAVGLSRPMLGVHWPTDVIGGWLLGLSFAVMGATLVRSWEGAR